MPQESTLAHRNVSSPGSIPYISNQSPTVTDPCYISGSTDILTSIIGYAERRPGFADAVETTPTTFVNLQRLFTFERNDGAIYIMACDLLATNVVKVYKYFVDSDTSFVLIYTESIASGIPYDFVVSNNTLYFSNGLYAKKWDPANGVSNWGIAIGSVTGSTSAYAGTGTDAAFGSYAWTNPSNVVGAPDATYAVAGPGIVQTHYLQATNYGFSIPLANKIVGLAVNVTAHQTGWATDPPPNIVARLIINGSVSDPPKVLSLSTTGDSVYPFGGSSDTWAGNLSPSIINSATFGVAITVDFNLNFADSITAYVDSAQIVVYSLGGPVISVSASAGTMSATVGYQYVFTYGNSNTGHISSPTPVSASTGVFTNKLKVTITLTASTDPQVNQIHLYRTTDSATGLGGQNYFELPTSPYPNSSGNVDDAATDSALNAFSIAPIPTFNDPPIPIQGMVYFSGRIWGFTGNKVWFSGLEEITVGVPEESFPSGVAGNFWAFDQPVKGLGIAGIGDGQVIVVFCPGRIYSISGNTLDTFRRSSVSNRRGCRNLATVTMIGGMCAWLDTANQIWATDGNSLQELSVPIRPDLDGITQANCSMTFHTDGRFHWLVFSTGAKLIVYDIDQEQWMPPWSFACQYLFSGEKTAGNYELMAAKPTKTLQMSETTFKDNGATYQPIIKTNLFSIVPDFGKRFSYIAAGSYDEPTRTGAGVYLGIDNNGKTFSDVLVVIDDDPTQATYISQATNLQDTGVTFNRANGNYIIQNIYPISTTTGTYPVGRWMGLQFKLANADQVDKVYGWYLSYESKR